MTHTQQQRTRCARAFISSRPSAVAGSSRRRHMPTHYTHPTRCCMQKPTEGQRRFLAISRSRSSHPSFATCVCVLKRCAKITATGYSLQMPSLQRPRACTETGRSRVSSSRYFTRLFIIKCVWISTLKTPARHFVFVFVCFQGSYTQIQNINRIS